MLIRVCPGCKSERPVHEVSCEAEVQGGLCGWDLLGVDVQESGASPPAPAAPPPAARLCTSGHPMAPGDLLCATCESPAAEPPVSPPPGPEPAQDAAVIEGWRLGERLASTDPGVERFAATRVSDGRTAVLTRYTSSSPPEPAVYDAWQRLPPAHVPELLARGRTEEGAFDVVEAIQGGDFSSLAGTGIDATSLRPIVEQLGSALGDLSICGLRHRNLRPSHVQIRTREPLDLVITGFSAARISEFELDIAPATGASRYSAPETLAGAVAAASDWWSAGMLLLEHVTRGACFQGVNEQAFLIHVLTQGITAPPGLDPAVDTLLRGLLARDRRERWQWREVQAWLAGNPTGAPAWPGAEAPPTTGAALTLAGQPHRSAASFALAAADATHWEEARNALLRGAVSSWAEAAHFDPIRQSTLREIVRDVEVPEDWKLSLALKVLNPAMPLIVRGQIVVPGWLLANLQEGYALLSGPVPDYLRKLDAESWLVHLKFRATAVRTRATQLEIGLNEEELRVLLLTSSLSRLTGLWEERRRRFPDSEHAALAGLMSRKPGEEDLIVLLAASIGQFRPLSEVVEAAAREAAAAKVSPFDKEAASGWLLRPRRELYQALDERIARFARCGISRPDEWADSFRLDRRLPLPRALVLLAVPQDRWSPLPGQAYLSTLLEFFSRRITTGALRGPLARMRIGRTSSRIDLTELGTARVPATEILAQLLARTSQVTLDPAAFAEGILGSRLRQLQSRALLYRRDTGIDGLYLGFPFLLIRDSESTAPRIAPVLLWPVRIKLEVGNRAQVSLAFGRDRSVGRESEQVILNPAFEGILGQTALKRWEEVADELLTRETSVAAVMDAFGTLAASRGSTLAKLPGSEVVVEPHRPQLAPAAVLFHMTFMGQAIVKDLEVLRGMPLEGTGLATALHLDKAHKEQAATCHSPEVDRYFTASSDPSQEAAVMDARAAPGLVIEGPPGTGKSQTIVNMVADAIGRGKSLLVICQKQAALEVVYKRLERENLGDRIMMLTDASADREAVVRTIREQIDAVYDKSSATAGSQRLGRDRAALATRIESLEREVDTHQGVLHRIDERIGRSYRMVISELIPLASTLTVSAPGLRAQLIGLHPTDLASLEDDCAAIAPYWLKAKVEDSPLSVLRTFSPDPGNLQLFRNAFSVFTEAENARWSIIQDTPGAVTLQDPAQVREWLTLHEPSLQVLSPQERRDVLHAYLTSQQNTSLLTDLPQVRADLAALDSAALKAPAPTRLRALDPDLLSQAAHLSAAATRPVTGLQKLGIGRWLARRRLTRFIATLLPTRASLEDFAQAVALENRFRALRMQVASAAAVLQESLPQDSGDAAAYARLAGTLHTRLSTVHRIVQAAGECPDVARALAQAHEDRDPDPIVNCLTRLERSLRRSDARAASRSRLDDLTDYFEPSWMTARQQAIHRDISNAGSLAALQAALPTLQPYQEFRVRAVGLGDQARAVLRVLRAQEAALAPLSPAELAECVRNTLATEARLAWKIRIESESPAVFLDNDTLAKKVEALAKADQEMRDLNRKLLCSGIDRSRLGSKGEWEEVTRLRGQRALRLREFMDRARDLGLLALRPVWLMTPDVASRVLQPTAGLFDTVIYDEASQMPVEYALPTLFRSKVVIISGDEKQMPPTSFFSSRLEGDDELYEGEEPDEDASQEEKTEHQETQDRREIQDYADLLQLGRKFLPVRTLQVHYRSQYRELIAFSNAAFYGDRLSVPVRHPVEVIRQTKPIEFIGVNGQYQDQINPAEAQAVVDYLARLWSQGVPPTLGVVTFNRKQADLIEDVIEERAGSDPDFRAHLLREREREEEGADMGFFVKNVENVQGDERDVILFSTTFGRNAQGKFRRNFGVLGQTGGERRLNVAISRARVKVVLITSMPVEEISGFLSGPGRPTIPRDHLQAYMQYARLVSDGTLDTSRSLLKRVLTDASTAGYGTSGERDGFIDSVAAFLKSEAWQAADARDGGAFGLDFAIVNPRTGLYSIGIECDAPRHPILANARAREVWRPSVLKRAVPHIHRLSSLAWLQSPEQEKARLRTAVQKALA